MEENHDIYLVHLLEFMYFNFNSIFLLKLYLIAKFTGYGGLENLITTYVWFTHWWKLIGPLKNLGVNQVNQS